MMRRPGCWIVLLLVALIALFAWVAFGRLQPPPFVDPATLPRSVTTKILHPQAFERTYTTQGLLEARNRIDMNAETPGTIVSDCGDRRPAGDTRAGAAAPAGR